MYQIAICDDDPKLLKAVSDVTETFFRRDTQKSKIKKYLKGLELKKDIMSGQRFDIIITDIEMLDISGLDLAAAIRKKDPDVILIFVTAYEKYAVVGYEFSIFRYVPKNMLSEKLPKALAAAKQKMENPNTDMYLVEKSDEVFPLPQKDILYIYREGKNSVLVTAKDTIKVRSTLIKTFEKLNPANFFFAERGYIVNIEQIASVQRDTLTMKNRTRLPIGPAYIQETKKRVADYWNGRMNKRC